MIADSVPVVPFGAWPSPVSAACVASGVRRIDDLAVVAGSACWLVRRPGEGGRNVLVRRDPDGSVVTVTPDGFDVRSRVHEYGGGAFRFLTPDVHAFVNFRDQRVYLARGASVVPLTPDDGARYADLVADPARRRLLAVQERPGPAGNDERASLVAIPLPSEPLGGSGGEPAPPVELASGADFISSPRVSPDGARLAWLTWNHPDMPWDATALHFADLDAAGMPVGTRVVAGGDPARPEAVQQPGFDLEGRLVFMTDRTGWWNPYSMSSSGAIRPLCRREAEFGVPSWLFGMSTWASTPAGIVAACCLRGVWRLVLIPDGDVGEEASVIPLTTPYTSIAWLRGTAEPAPGWPAMGRRENEPSSAEEAAVLFLGAAPDRPREVVRLGLSDGDEPTLEVLVSTGAMPDPRYLSTGRPVEFASAEGRRAHAFFYAPRNDDFEAPAGTKPPLIVVSHGGPTSATEHVHDIAIQFWTSRGFAVVDVNYGGSTGHGRAYRESLRGRWGLVDVEDCAAAAETLAERGEVDPGKLLIRGGSAGGFTTLAALAFRDTFAAGASYYGVADLSALARDTHKFESRYLDGLIGPYPERADLYRERSPLLARERFSCPVIFFQGDQDPIVPPNQAEAMVEALRSRGLAVDYLLFRGEQHGFRQAVNIVRALEAELAFYGAVCGFDPSL